jgi:hypothetical protein
LPTLNKVTNRNQVNKRNQNSFPYTRKTTNVAAVIDTTELDLGKHAYSQMKDFGVDPEVINTAPLNAPRKIAQTSHENFILIINSKTNYTEQIIQKTLDLEKQNTVEKIIIEKQNESRESMKRRAKRKTRETAEKLAEQIQKT